MARPDVNDMTVDSLEREVKKSRTFKKFWKNYKFDRKGHSGKVELIAYNKMTKEYFVYIVRCRQNPANISIAERIYQDYRKAYPRDRTRGFFVYPRLEDFLDRPHDIRTTVVPL